MFTFLPLPSTVVLRLFFVFNKLTWQNLRCIWCLHKIMDCVCSFLCKVLKDSMLTLERVMIYGDCPQFAKINLDGVELDQSLPPAWKCFRLYFPCQLKYLTAFKQFSFARDLLPVLYIWHMEVYSKFRVVLVPAEHKKPLCLVQGKLGLRFLVLLHLMPLVAGVRFNFV